MDENLLDWLIYKILLLNLREPPSSSHYNHFLEPIGMRCPPAYTPEQLNSPEHVKPRLEREQEHIQSELNTLMP